MCVRRFNACDVPVAFICMIAGRQVQKRYGVGRWRYLQCDFSVVPVVVLASCGYSVQASCCGWDLLLAASFQVVVTIATNDAPMSPYSLHRHYNGLQHVTACCKRCCVRRSLLWRLTSDALHLVMHVALSLVGCGVVVSWLVLQLTMCFARPSWL